MSLIRYSDPELRHLLTRTISVRWPGEFIVIVTPCQASPDGTRLLSHAPDASDPMPPAEPTDGSGDAVVAATESRLIYQERLTHAVVFRAIAMILGAVAAVTLFTGGGLATFALIGTTALVLWTGAKLAEALTVGKTSMEFDRIELIDQSGQMIEGTNPSGTPLRLWVPDASDFRMILSLVNGSGRAAA